MPTLRELLQIEYYFEYNLKKQKQYGKISLYDGGNDLAARWYVYYSFRNPASGKLERQPPIYLNINDFDTIRERKKAARLVIASIKNILEGDFNPYANPALENIVKVDDPKVIALEKTASQAIDVALTVGKSKYAETAYPDFKSRVKQFQKYILERGYGAKKISEVPESLIIDFLNIILERSSPRNRNNTRIALSDMYTIIYDNRLIAANPIQAINTMTAKPKKNRAFTDVEADLIIDHLNETDNWLALYIKFVSISLLRPIEVCRLQVYDLNLKGKLIKVRAKNQPVKTKIIPHLLYKDIPDLSKCRRTDYLFTPIGPDSSETGEVNRRNYWSDEFKKVKDILGFGPEYSIYSFRHTYITRLFRALRVDYSPFEAKSHLMLITGHTSMKALEMYLRDIDAELPEDYSHLLKTKKPLS